ncbi:unnamed protein product [Alopecurus aequalis]
MQTIIILGRGGVQGAASPEGSSGEGGTAEWRRVYGRIEALAADRARWQEISRTQRELWEAREKSLRARLLQADASRTRWKTAYIELPLLANPKIAELQEEDLNNYTTCEDGDGLELKETRTVVELGKNNEDHESIAGDLRTELRKLKQACKTLCTCKDTEMSALLGAAQATEAAHNLQHNIEELQVAARNKDDKLMQIFVKIGDGKTISVKVKRSDTVYDVKAKIEDKEGISPGQQRLMFGDKLLVGSCTLKDYSISHMRTLTLHLVLQGMHILVRKLTGKTMTFEVERADTVYSVKAKIFDVAGYEPAWQRLTLDKELLEDARTLADYDIQNNSTLLFAFTLCGKRHKTVGRLKARIHAKSYVSPDQQCLYWRRKLLENDCVLETSHVEYDLILELRLPGGQ